MAHNDETQSTSHSDPPLPDLEPIPPQPRPNRRARVEDDDDDDRDRRHPSQRINTPLPLPDPVASLFDNIGVPRPPPPPTAGAPPTNMPQFTSGGIAFSVDIGPDFTAAQGGQPPIPGFPPEMLREMFGMEPDVEDPERADRLLQGLEEVPVGLVRRLERVGGSAGANGEDLSGGDSGCAVCWEKLLDQDSEEQPKIVSLPCAHVFHADCLRPWFSRPKHTTCPTCRFNIDPEDLTFVPYSQRQRTQERREEAAGSPAQTAQPPPAATPDNAASASTTDPTQGPPAASDEARGRMGPPPTPGAASTSTRRTSSEPPTGRAPRTRPSPEIVQSFAVPGGHVVVVNHPIGIFSDAQGRPTGVTGQQPQEASQTPAGADGAQPPQPPGVGQVPAPAPQPTSPPAPGMNAIPRMTMPGGAQLPPGVVAFDIHLPFPIPFPPLGAQPAPQPANAAPQPPPQGQPNPRPPGPGFAGINAGQAIVPVDISDIMRRMFGAAAPAPPAANAAAPPPTAPSNTAAPETTVPPPAPFTVPSNAPPIPQPSAEAQAEGGQPPLPGIENLLRGYLNNPAFMFRLMMSAALAGAIPLNAMPGAQPRADPNAPKKQWTVPTAPGPTLRQRIERREREAGLRCFDVSCGVGPSDEEPVVALSEALAQQCSIRSGGGGEDKPVCGHTFHSSCLVSAERVALRGVDAVVVDGNVEVSCPVCRGAGVISKKEWDEGVLQLE